MSEEALTWIWGAAALATLLFGEWVCSRLALRFWEASAARATYLVLILVGGRLATSGGVELKDAVGLIVMGVALGPLATTGLWLRLGATHLGAPRLKD